jgi:pimeloyl-ACP methyl ester carboxylesterase
MKSLFFLLFVFIFIQRSFSQVANGTKFTVVSGKKVAYNANSLETRKPGEPVVVFEGGIGSGKETFQFLLPFLPKTLPWIMYDRAGLSESEPDTTIKTDAEIVRRLHKFLAASKILPPYLLVGHSLGGPYIRLFTSFYPGEVAGLVFIDPTNFLLSNTEDVKIKETSKSSMGYMALFSNMMKKFSSDTTIPFGVRYEMRRRHELNRRGYFWEYRSLSPLPDIPVTVLIAYNSPIEHSEKALFKEYKINGLEWFREVNKYRIDDYADMIKNNNNSSLVLLPGYPHVIHHRDPMLVSAAIMEVYKKSLDGKQ